MAAALLVSLASWSATPQPQGLPSPSPHPPPSIQSLLKPEIFRRLIGDRELVTHAKLEDLPPPQIGKRYSFYAAMQVKGGLHRVRAILTNYSLYAELIKFYVDHTVYSPVTRVLDVQGGLWNWKLRSFVRFDERSDRWIHYEIVGGHFKGLEGDMFFEDAKEKGTLVYFRGEQRANHWPPQFVIERGAEIVFGFTASRMRKYVESREDEKGEKTGTAQDVAAPAAPRDKKPDAPSGPNEKRSNDGQNFPQPRSRL
jgi:hypothetical protein